MWKDFPVLGQVSTFAALASMAAQKQGKYLALHKALMGAADRLTEESVMQIAGQDRARRRAASSGTWPTAEIITYLQETQRLARELGINGTPAFVIGNTLVPGAVDGARLRQLIAEGPPRRLIGAPVSDRHRPRSGRNHTSADRQ